MDYLIGIDIGTSSVKALALGPGGKSLGVSKRGYAVFADGNGQHEEDPEAIYEATLAVLSELVSSLSQTHRLTGVSFSAAMHGLLALDAAGLPLTRLITWADTRASAVTAVFKNTDTAHSIYRLTGTPIHPMSPLCKLRWLRDAQPGIFARAATFVSIKEYVWYRLFGVFEIDHSVASATGLFDTRGLIWCDLALEAAGIQTGQLSLPVPVTFLRRNLPAALRTALNLPDIPFIIGGGDGCLANLGSGVVSRGQASVTIGTSGAVRVLTPTWKPDAQERLFNYLLTDTLYVRGGATNNGGNLLDWFMEVVGQGEDLEQWLAEAFRLPEGSEGLLFLPYLYGERAPIWDAGARGAFIGLRAHHTKAHLLRAVTEGICYALFEILRILDETDDPQPTAMGAGTDPAQSAAAIDVVYASGGFTRNAAWVQQLADVLGKPVHLTEEADASATGAVLLGMLALGTLASISDARSHIREGARYLPRPEKHDLYLRYMALYTSLYPSLKTTFNELDLLHP